MSRDAGALSRRLAVAIVAVVLAAPLAAPIQSITSHCNTVCPMHARHKLHCHGTAAAAARGHGLPAAGCTTLAIAMPGCSCSHGTPTASMPRAVLSGPALAWRAQTRLAVNTAPPEFQARCADPPESPPPIFSV
jgi:hypothetical protein